MRKHIMLALCALALGLTGCDSYKDYEDSVFITGTLSSSNIRVLVDGQTETAITVSSTAKVAADVPVEVKADPAKLDAYNATTGRTYQMPPEGSYTLEGEGLVIPAGKAQSTPIRLHVDSERLQEGVAYCLPVTITGVGGGSLGVLETSRTAYLVLTKVITVKAAYLHGSQSFDIPSFGGDNSPVKALTQLTLEMKVCPQKFGGIASLCGCEENFLFRFGDGAGGANNKLQLAKASIGSAAHPNDKDHYEGWSDNTFDVNKWVHVSAVYDGQYLRVYVDGEQMMNVETRNGGTINLSMAYNGQDWSDTFSIGRSVGHARFFNGYVSECRVWNRARTASEIEDGMCYVDPASEGLIAYWRFNGEVQDDGTVRDETGHGYNAVPYGNVTYVDNQKCPF